MKIIQNFRRDTSGDAIVEAAILFPIIIMIFSALVLLSMYLPQRLILQESAQIAATAIATERSDTWIAFNENAAFEPKDVLVNVYVSSIRNAVLSRSADEAKATAISEHFASKGFINTSHDISVDYDVVNYVIYQEIVVTVTQTIPLRQFGLSFIGFPENMVLTQEARAVIQNGDEFVRNIDIAKDIMHWIDNKFEISESITSAFEKAGSSEIRGIFGF